MLERKQNSLLFHGHRAKSTLKSGTSLNKYVEDCYAVVSCTLDQSGFYQSLSFASRFSGAASLDACFDTWFEVFNVSGFICLPIVCSEAPSENSCERMDRRWQISKVEIMLSSQELPFSIGARLEHYPFQAPFSAICSRATATFRYIVSILFSDLLSFD